MAVATDIERRPLPKGWRWVKLGDVAEVVRGVTFKKAVSSGTPVDGWVPVLRAGNISNQLLTAENLVWIPPDLVSGPQMLAVGDIAICLSSGSPKLVGKSARLTDAWIGSVGSFCAILRAIDLSFGSYLIHFLRSPMFVKWRDSQARGSSIQNLRTTGLENMDIPIPPPAEQQQIAGILDEQMTAVEKAKRAAQERLEAVQALPAAYRREAIPSVDEVLPEAWRRVRLGEVCNVKGGGQPPKQVFSNTAETGLVRLLQIRDFVSDQHAVYVPDKAPLTKCVSSDVLIGRYGASVGKILTGKSGAINVALVKTIPDERLLSRLFSYHLLLSDDFQRSLLDGSDRSAQAGFNRGQLLGIEIPLPPLAEQMRIAARLEGINSGVKLAEEAVGKEIDSIETMPEALLRQAFGGVI